MDGGAEGRRVYLLLWSLRETGEGRLTWIGCWVTNGFRATWLNIRATALLGAWRDAVPGPGGCTSVSPPTSAANGRQTQAEYGMCRYAVSHLQDDTALCRPKSQRRLSRERRVVVVFWEPANPVHAADLAGRCLFLGAMIGHAFAYSSRSFFTPPASTPKNRKVTNCCPLTQHCHAKPLSILSPTPAGEAVTMAPMSTCCPHR